jgi:SAM-dependent methyltransferase
MQFRPRNARRAQCPICGYAGRFWSFGNPPRRGAICPDCGAKERDRLLALWLAGRDVDPLAGRRILHVAPEPCFRRQTGRAAVYETADLMTPGVDHRIDLAAIPFADGAWDVVICNHVLEHVADDRAALREIRRVLGSGGLAVLMVPIVDAWPDTYEDPSIVAPAAREQHFGQYDHVRRYGSDYPERIAAAGFRVERFVATPRDCVRHALVPGESVFAGHV